MEKAETHKFYLTSKPFGRRLIDEPEGFDQDKTVYELNSQGRYYEVKQDSNIVLTEKAFNYIRDLRNLYGVNEEVRLIHVRKNYTSMAQEYEEIYNYGLNLKDAKFDHESDNRTVELEVITGGLLEDIESHWQDEYDITAQTNSYDDKSDLPFVNIYLEPRQIFRRTRWNISAGTTGLADDLLPNRAYGVPFNVDAEVVSDQNAVSAPLQEVFIGGDLANGGFGGMFYEIADRDRNLRIEIDLNVILNRGFQYNQLDLGIYTFNNGDQYTYKGYTPLHKFFRNFQDLNQVLSYKSGVIELTVLQGESLALGLVHDSPGEDLIQFEYAQSTMLVEEDSTFQATCTRALKPFDFFNKLCGLQGHEFNSEIFGPGGKYENLLITHGTWLRNMPQIVNEGFENERRIQSSVSIGDAFEAFDVVEPMRYDEENRKFFMGLEEETQQNFTITRIEDSDGNLQEVAEKKSSYAGNDYYSGAEIGSQSSGSNYGSVNNLESINGLARWELNVRKSDSKYVKTTNWRMGSEDVEICRQLQWNLNPDLDSEFDNDWFLIDCKLSNPIPGCEYEPRKWDEFFDAIPRNVYSYETNYNWRLTPRTLLYNHSWKLSPAIIKEPGGAIEFRSSNCNSSLITKEIGQREFRNDEPFPHGLMKRPTVDLEVFTFTTVLSDKNIEDLKGNKKGRIPFLFNGETIYGRIIKASAQGSFEVIKAL